MIRKALFLLALVSSISGKSGAQITLDSTSFGGLQIVADSFSYIQGSIPPMELGPNKVYDYTNVAFEQILYYSPQDSGTLAEFPGARMFETRRHVLKDSFYFPSYRWSRLSAAGLERVGEEIPRRGIALSEFAIPSTQPTDSIIIPAQNRLYSQPYQLLQFPCTYGKTWTSRFSMTVDMELNYDFAGFIDRPLQYKTETQYEFEVAGWGTALVYHTRTGEFGQDDVLLLRIKGRTVDSLFFDGAPAPVYLMDYFGFTQGRVTETNFDELFRARNLSPLVLYQYSGNQFSTPALARVQQLKMPGLNLGEARNTDSEEMGVYPNPLTGSSPLYIRLPQGSKGQWVYTLRTIDGQVMAKGSWEHTGEPGQIRFPSSLPAGIYWVTIGPEPGGEARHFAVDWRP